MAEVKKELEAEIKIAPNSAAAVFVLGEIERRAGAWDAAIRYFTRAMEMDVGFLEAYLALGMSLSAAGKHGDAIAPLERYTKASPEDPTGHFQFTLAYSRTGNKEAAEREMRLHRDTAAKTGTSRPPNAQVRP